jgi:hypothetical protein
MNATEIHTIAETAFDAACATYKQAAADFKRSRSAKNRAAFVAASQTLEVTAEACRNAQDRMQREAEVEARKAVLAPRVALRAAQVDLFA